MCYRISHQRGFHGSGRELGVFGREHHHHGIADWLHHGGDGGFGHEIGAYFGRKNRQIRGLGWWRVAAGHGGVDFIEPFATVVSKRIRDFMLNSFKNGDGVGENLLHHFPDKS